MDITWYCLKVTLQTSQSPLEKQKILINRFKNAKRFERAWGEKIYTYKISDVQTVTLHGRKCLIGRINRGPKVAHGRRVDDESQTSSEAQEYIKDLDDSTEFVYDLISCEMAVHQRYPFNPSDYTFRAIRSMIGNTVENKQGKLFDVHVEPLRQSDYSDKLIEEAEVLSSVSLTYAKPNPGTGDDELDMLDFGQISELIESDYSKVDFSSFDESGLNKDEDGFIRKSIRALLDRGYMKSGKIVLDDQKVNLTKSETRTVVTDGYAKLENRQNELLQRMRVWVGQLIANSWPFGLDEKKSDGKDH